MKINYPTISVVIPCYNGSVYLREAIESVLAQTQHVHEIIFVDDGSTDNSTAIAASFGPPVRLIRQSKSGAPAARNRGFEESSGDFIQFLDADDLLAPNKIEVQMRQLAAEPDAIATCPWAASSIVPRTLASLGPAIGAT